MKSTLTMREMEGWTPDQIKATNKELTNELTKRLLIAFGGQILVYAVTRYVFRAK